MAQEDYPYCIFCDSKVINLVVRGNEVAYRCMHCGMTVVVEDNA